MRVEKCVLNDALRGLGKVVCQTSPVELYRSIRFVGDTSGELLAQAAPLVDRAGYRRVLHGINLSNAGVTVTDGKQLLHLPCVLSLAKDLTIPLRFVC